MAVTRMAIRQEVGKQLGGFVVTSTAGAVGSFTVANDPRFQGPTSVSDRAHTGTWAYAADGNAAAQTRICTTLTPSSGLQAVEPNYGSAISTDDIELHPRIHPERINDSINRALRDMYYELWFPLTLVANGGFEESTLTNWSGTNANLALDTDGSDVVRGTGSMSVTSTSANGYAGSDNVPVEGDESYFLWVDVRATGAFTAEIQAYDVTNSAALNLTGDPNTWTNNDWGTRHFGFSTEATTDNVTIRIVVQESSGVVHVDNVIMLKNRQTVYNLPSWVRHSRADVIQALIDDSQAEDALSRTFTDFPGFPTVTANPNAATPSTIILPFSPVVPVWIKAVRPFLDQNGVMATDAITTTADFNWVTTRTLVEVYGLLRDEQAGIENKFWSRRRLETLDRAKRLNRRWNPGQSPRRVIVKY
jgi:hypothetical protein